MFGKICKMLSKTDMKCDTKIYLVSYIDEYGWKNSKAIGRKVVFQKDDLKITIEDGYKNES